MLNSLPPSLAWIIVTTLLMSIILMVYYVKSKRKNVFLKKKLAYKQGLLNQLPYVLDKTWVFKNKKVISISEIRYIKSVGNDVTYYLTDDKVVSERQSIKALSRLLPQPPFVQVHRSVLVNTHHLKEVNKTSVLMQDNTLLTVTKTFREQLMQSFNITNP